MNFINLLTKQQVLIVYGVKAPKPNTKITVGLLDGYHAVIEKSQYKSTYGKALYRCEHIPKNNA